LEQAGQVGVGQAEMGHWRIVAAVEEAVEVDFLLHHLMQQIFQHLYRLLLVRQGLLETVELD
jgi:hypothetical protein